jgi:predicted ATPase
MSSLLIVETTRRPRRGVGWEVVPLRPLHVPFHEVAVPRDLLGCPVLQAFLPLVSAARPDFENSPENLRYALDVCRSLDGLPRALEAAAAWFAFYPPALVAQIAREDPRALAATSEGATPRSWLTEALDDALDCLTERQLDLLIQLAGQPTPWTLKELATGSYGTSGGLVESVHTLLAAGLIRPIDADGQAFTVLNVLRSALI